MYIIYKITVTMFVVMNLNHVRMTECSMPDPHIYGISTFGCGVTTNLQVLNSTFSRLFILKQTVPTRPAEPPSVVVVIVGCLINTIIYKRADYSLFTIHTHTNQR